MLTGPLTAGQSHDIGYEILEVNGSWSRSLVVYWYEEYVPFCGDDIVEGDEVCDGTDLAGESCQTHGFDTGTLTCLGDCSGYDTSGCRNFECGNSICELSAGEDCVSCPSDCNGIQSGQSEQAVLLRRRRRKQPRGLHGFPLHRRREDLRALGSRRGSRLRVPPKGRASDCVNCPACPR